jgi:hypothetical protein
MSTAPDLERQPSAHTHWAVALIGKDPDMGWQLHPYDGHYEAKSVETSRGTQPTIFIPNANEDHLQFALADGWEPVDVERVGLRSPSDPDEPPLEPLIGDHKSLLQLTHIEVAALPYSTKQTVAKQLGIERYMSKSHGWLEEKINGKLDAHRREEEV